MNAPEETTSSAGETKRKVFAALGIRAAALDPSDITKRMGIQPSHSFARGDQYHTHVAKTKMEVRSRTCGVWQISSESDVRSCDLQDHIDYLLGLILPKRAEIDALLADKDIYLDVRLWVESRDPVNGFTLRSDSVAALASLCREFNVSVIGGQESPEVF